MKIKTTIAVVALLSSAAFGASAAQLVSTEQAQNLQSAGTITVSGINAAPSDIRQQLSEKADSQGASAYRVVEARLQDNYHVTAEIYK